MTNEELKSFLEQNRENLIKKNYDAIYSNIDYNGDMPQITAFFLIKGNRNPLEYMNPSKTSSTVLSNMFNDIRSYGVKLVTIPEEFSDSKFENVDVDTLVVEAPLNGDMKFRLDISKIKKLIISDGTISFSGNIAKSNAIDLIKLPSTLKKIKKGAFESTSIIGTNRRTSKQDMLVISEADKEYFKKNLRYFREKSSINQEEEQ